MSLRETRWYRASQRLITAHPDALCIAVITLIGVVIRLGMLYRAPGLHYERQPELLSAWLGLAHGLEPDLELRRTPLYPWFVAAALRVLGDNLDSIALVQHVIGIGTTIALFWAARSVFGRPVGLGAALLTAISGPLLIFEHYVMPEALFTFLLVLGVGICIHGVQTGQARWFAIAGAVIAAAASDPPGPAQLVILSLPIVLLLARVPWQRLVGWTSLAVAGFAVVTLPWMFSVYQEYGVFSSGATLGEPLIFRVTQQDRGFSLPDASLEPR